jgi:predicted NUDIX family NTP pyrophosphohydrolase
MNDTTEKPKPVPHERISAGLLMYRRRGMALEFFLAHPGGPFNAHLDDGGWTIPKGEPVEGEELLAAARREFEEETGIAPSGPLIELGRIRQKGGKWVHAWAFPGDHEGPVRSNTCRVEWPIESGRFVDFPEVDRAEFFDLERARRKLKETQVPFLERLIAALAAADKGAPIPS